jgi:hypothetical protein
LAQAPCRQPHASEGTTFEQFAPAYQVGAEAVQKYPEREFDEIEVDVALDYEKHEVGSALPGTMFVERRRRPGRKSAASFRRANLRVEFAAAFEFRRTGSCVNATEDGSNADPFPAASDWPNE